MNGTGVNFGYAQMVPDRDQLGHLGEAALLEDVQPHHRVLEQEASGVVAVGADAADLRREVEDQVGSGVRHQAADRTAVDQVVLRERGTTTLAPLAAQLLDDEAAQEAGAAGDDDSLLLPKRAHGAGEFYHETRAGRAPLRRLPRATSARSASRRTLARGDLGRQRGQLGQRGRRGLPSGGHRRRPA